MIEKILLREQSPSRSELFDAMVHIRGIELALRDASVDGEVEGPLHVSLGEEAVAVGIAAAMRRDDVLLSNHRGHGHALTLGLDIATVIAEIVGHPSGFAGGRGGSMHIFAPDSGFLGTNGIVGGNAGVATGVGLALQLEGKQRVAIVVFGDGAMGTGIVYESINLAALWKLPVIFICENNGYAEMTPTAVHLSTSPVERVRGFGIAAERIDGIDVEAVWMGVAGAAATAREGRPVFLEAQCFRFGGHYAADPARYRPAGEDHEWRTSRCPIRRLGTKLGLNESVVEARVDAIWAEAATIIKRYAA